MSPNLLRFTAALVALAAQPGLAQTPSGNAPPALTMTAANLQGADQRHREFASTHNGKAAALPGDTLRYRVTFTNVQHDSVRNVQFNDPLPSGLEYLGGSAHADRNDVDVTYSIDAGKTYSAQPMTTELVDGRPVRKPAPVAMYTNVRWTLRGWVKPGAQVTAEFDAHLPTDGRVKP